MSRISTVLCILLVSAPLLAADSDAIRETLLAHARGVEAGDLSAIAKVWANDDSVVVFENGRANNGWADYRDHHLGRELAAFKNTHYTLTDITPHVSGDTAWATFKYALTADTATRHIDGSGVGTAGLERRGGQWRIVHWHSSSSTSRSCD
jgi:ketosteroid isomerase-like protein